MIDLCVLRQTVHSFYTTRKGALTMKSVLVTLKADNSERQMNVRKRGYS